MSGPIDRGRDETPQQRADRNLSELLQELRVALPGVQVLFAFLLTVPFTQRFNDLSPFAEKLYFGVLLCTALATVFLIAPSVAHWILFHRQEKEYLVVVSHRLALVGTAFMALSICGAVALISDFIFGTTTTLVATSAIVLTFALLWYVGPLLRRRRDMRGEF